MALDLTGKLYYHFKKQAEEQGIEFVPLQFKGVPGAPNFEWLDERPYPSQAELDAAEAAYDAEQAVIANNKAAEQTFKNAIAEGFTYYTKTYDCSDYAINGYANLLTLLNTDLNWKTEIKIMLKDKTIHTLTTETFKNFCLAIGNHVYALRETYWNSLQ